MSLKEPIVEGAYYEQDGTKRILGPAVAAYNALTPHFVLNGKGFRPNGEPLTWGELGHLTRRVYIATTDPAEVVAELRGLQLSAHRDSHSEFGGRTDEAKEEAFCEAADLVAKKLGVES